MDWLKIADLIATKTAGNVPTTAVTCTGVLRLVKRHHHPPTSDVESCNKHILGSLVQMSTLDVSLVLTAYMGNWAGIDRCRLAYFNKRHLEKVS